MEPTTDPWGCEGLSLGGEETQPQKGCFAGRGSTGMGGGAALQTVRETASHPPARTRGLPGGTRTPFALDRIQSPLKACTSQIVTSGEETKADKRTPEITVTVLGFSVFLGGS